MIFLSKVEHCLLIKHAKTLDIVPNSLTHAVCNKEKNNIRRSDLKDAVTINGLTWSNGKLGRRRHSNSSLLTFPFLFLSFLSGQSDSRLR